MSTAKNENLQISKDAYHLSKLELLFQRCGYFLMLILLTGAFFGFFGEGIIKTIRGNEISVSYDKTMRRQNTSSLEINIKNIPNQFLQIPITISEDYLKQFYIKQILPEPKSSSSSNGQITYFFDNAKGNKNLKIYFLLEPQHSGLVSSTLIFEKKQIMFKQFIYP